MACSFVVKNYNCFERK